MKDWIIKSIAAMVVFSGLAELSWAVTPVTRYVVTTCANNGDGTSTSCAASNGAAGAYKTLGQGYADVASDYADFVSSDVAVTIECSGSTADSYDSGANQNADINVTTDATRTLTIQAAATDTATALWSTSKYRISGSYYNAILKIRAAFVTIKNLQMENTKTGAGGGTFGDGIWLNLSGTAGKIVISGNLMRYSGDYTNQNAISIRDDFSETSGTTKVFRNNVTIGWKGAMSARPANSGTVYVYNNTCYSNASGATCFVMRGNTSATTVAKNNLANGTATGWDIDVSSTWTHNNNLSEDTSSPDNTYDSKAVTFENEGGGDYHLASGDTNAKDLGADLSAATEGFSTDIDGQTRSGTWDIGADEYQASAASTISSMGSFYKGMQR